MHILMLSENKIYARLSRISPQWRLLTKLQRHFSPNTTLSKCLNYVKYALYWLRHLVRNLSRPVERSYTDKYNFEGRLVVLYNTHDVNIETNSHQTLNYLSELRTSHCHVVDSRACTP